MRSPVSNLANIHYAISVRGKCESQPIASYLQHFFHDIPLDQIDSVFGFLGLCTLYGGRHFIRRQISDDDVHWLNDRGIGVRIPLTNHFVNRSEYEFYHSFLRKYHHPLNSIIATEDNLALWLKEDFPQYTLEASVIKNINTPKKLETALAIYDTVVLPMVCNDDAQFLQSIESKQRIRLFANGGCAYTCPSRICYRSFSKMNKLGSGSFKCSLPLKARDFVGMVDFDLVKLASLGFYKFKLLREQLIRETGY